jgi:hypothetical protein
MYAGWVHGLFGLERNVVRKWGRAQFWGNNLHFEERK